MANKRLQDMTVAGTLADADRLYVEQGSGAGSERQVSISALIGAVGAFTQSGTGAVARTVGAKLKDSVSVADFGAIGDGVADDTAAIQLALNASSKVILLPGKTYKVSSALVPAFEGQYVIGGGRHGETDTGPIGGTTIKQMSSVDIFTVAKRGFTISDLNLTYGITPTAGACVNSSASSTSISRVYAGGACFDGFKFTTGGTGHSVSDFYLGGMVNSGIYVQGTNDVAVSNGVMAVHNSTNCPNGVVVFDGFVQAVNMSNVDILSGVYSIRCINIGAGVSSRASFCSFSNVYFDSAANGANLDGMFGCVFTNCWFSNRPGPGVVIGLASAAEGNSFASCRFTNCGSHGAALYSNAKWTTFTGCQFVANGQASSGHGIYVAPATTRFYVRGCISYNGQGLTPSQQYGIYVDTGASNFYEITHNDLQNNVAGTLLDGGTGSTKHVHANLGYNAPASVVTPTVGASPYTYSNTKGTPQLVVVTGGTVSAITIFGVTVYTTTGHDFILPPGQSATITYSSAPTVRLTDLF